MTCIVGLVDEGRVFIGGDSAASDETGAVVIRQDEKVFQNGPFIFGFCDSFRVGQLLRYQLDPPRLAAGADVFKFMVVDFVNEVRKVLMDGGVAKKEENVEEGGDFLVGFRSRLFHVCADFQAGEAADGFDACGAGTVAALSAMFATQRLSPRKRIQAALEAAEKFGHGVRRPFKVLSSRPIT